MYKIAHASSWLRFQLSIWYATTTDFEWKIFQYKPACVLEFNILVNGPFLTMTRPAAE